MKIRPRLQLLIAAIFLASPFGARAQSSNDWITVNKDYSSQRYVDLDQINTSNVSELKPVCEARLNEPSWFSSGVLMVGRTLYVSTLRATYAVDAATCELRWRDVIKLGPTANISSRGPGYLDGTIFRGTADGRVIALDAKTGKVLWDVKHADPAQNESFVAAPVAWKGKVFIGIAISDTGIRGRLIALDAKTGQELWRFYTVPPFGKGQPKGGGFWTTFSLDPATGEVLGPAANPAPDFEPWERPGANIYTNSVIALNADTGHLNWYYQHTPADDHDWDLGSAPTIYRTRSGKDMVAVAGKDGWVVGLDRATRAQMFKTPGTTITNHGPLPDQLTLVCPGLGGGSQFNGAAYDPGTGALYVGEVDWCSYFVKPEAQAKLQKEGEEESSDLSTAPTEPQSNAIHKHPDAVFTDYATQPHGMITAIDGETGRILWKYPTDAQMLAGLVPTKGGLVFAGDVRGNLFAFDAKSGAVLKHIDVDGALNSGLISYAVDGKQYVAASVGGVTLNPRGVSGPLALKIYGQQAWDAPKITTFDRQVTQTTGASANAELYSRMCAACHGSDGKGRTYASLTRMTQLGDPEVLKTFLANVPPPMPVLYPGLMTDDEVGMIAEFMKAKVIDKDGLTSAYVAPKSGGTPEWQAIYSVMVSPRCINCHSMADYPRQTDDRYPHVYHVERGEDDKGIEMKRCNQCHGMRNDPVTGAPGRMDWHMAPVIKSTESSPGVPKTGPRLCADLKDKSRNGNRDLAQLIDFIETDPFIQWAWDPGVRANGKPRTTPPMPTHDQFLSTVKKWVADGAPCPAQ
ncbi:MAG TPA: PQQ-binding-like beta-propeller repeat protein [Terriglobales bacterium]